MHSQYTKPLNEAQQKRFGPLLEESQALTDAEFRRIYLFNRSDFFREIDEYPQAYIASEAYAKWCRDVEAAGLANLGQPRLPHVEGYSKKPIPSKLRWAVFRRDKYICVRCGSDEDLTADHIIAERLGGETTLENLQSLCRRCNAKKGCS